MFKIKKIIYIFKIFLSHEQQFQILVLMWNIRIWTLISIDKMVSNFTIYQSEHRVKMIINWLRFIYAPIRGE